MNPLMPIIHAASMPPPRSTGSALTTLYLQVIITEQGSARLVQNGLKGEEYLRYGFADSLASIGGESDDAGNLTAREEHLPFGASAGADEEASEVKDRTRRYSGKERDATGLYYYGWRYYQPNSGRWLSADPGGLVDGGNLYRFCSNSPLRLRDRDGRMWEYAEDARLQPLADQLKFSNMNGILQDLGLRRETQPDSRRVAAYILSGVNLNSPSAINVINNLGAYKPPGSSSAVKNEKELTITDLLHLPFNAKSKKEDDESGDAYFNENLSTLLIDNVDKNRRVDSFKDNAISAYSEGGYSIISQTSAGTGIYRATYRPDVWKLYSLYRGRNDPFYTSDVIQAQYEDISKSKGFYGQLPKTIELIYVTNHETLAVLDKAEGQSDELLKTQFLSQAPLGKMVGHVMNSFKLNADKIEIRDLDIKVKTSMKLKQ